MAHQATHDSIELQLQELFLEVNSLSNRLKWLESPNTRLPSGGRAVLQCIVANGPLTVPQLAQARCTSRQNAQTLVNRLKRRDLVEITPNPRHQRSCLVRATPAASILVESLQGEEQQFNTAAQAICDAEEIRMASSVLRRLRQVMGGSAAPSIRLTEKTLTAVESRGKSRAPHPNAIPIAPFAGEELPVNLL